MSKRDIAILTGRKRNFVRSSLSHKTFSLSFRSFFSPHIFFSFSLVPIIIHSEKRRRQKVLYHRNVYHDEDDGEMRKNKPQSSFLFSLCDCIMLPCLSQRDNEKQRTRSDALSGHSLACFYHADAKLIIKDGMKIEKRRRKAVLSNVQPQGRGRIKNEAFGSNTSFCGVLDGVNMFHLGCRR